MMPEALVKFGLDTALRDFCNDIDKSGALAVKYQSLELENAVIDQTVSITIYRIVQELINNTIKHAGATSAMVQVTRTGDILAVTVEDDGKGFDTSILNRTKGIGWANIQNRVEFLKGKMDVHSGQDQGTSVHIEINT
jgi:signal transduction histidine kinase